MVGWASSSARIWRNTAFPQDDVSDFAKERRQLSVPRR